MTSEAQTVELDVCFNAFIILPVDIESVTIEQNEFS